MTKVINLVITESEFLDKLKKSEVILLYKKQHPLRKENYRLVTLLPPVSKVSGRILQAQVNNFMENKLSNYVTGFHKSNATQYSLMIMLQK